MSVQKILLYCHPDGSSSLKREGDHGPPQRCDNLVDAVALAHELKGDNSMQLIVYDAEGRVLLRSFA